MKEINTRIFITISLIFTFASAFAQTTADAKKAIDAEQYQKAKTLLHQLIIKEPGKDENYFLLGWVYLQEDYPDSAKIMFTNGISADKKSALNYVGLGAVAKLDNDQTEARANFDQATKLAGKNDEPYIYISKAYLMKPAPSADQALAVLNNAVKWGKNDPEYFIAIGDAYHAKLDNTKAFENYSLAQSLDPKAAYVDVAIGSLWEQADYYEGATKSLNDAIAIDPNYGPAYRELAETDLSLAKSDPKLASSKVKEGANYYKKFLDLTDRSPESQMRYADFLIEAGEYKTLEQVADDLAKSSKSNLRIYRYLGYAAYENKDYEAGLVAITKFMKEAAPKRIIPRDYIYLGHLQIKTNRDSIGILNLEKAADLDSTKSDLYSEIASIYYAKQKYKQAGDAFKNYIEKSHKGRLNDYFREGMSYYFCYSNQYYNSSGPATKADSMLLTLADSAFSYVQQKTASKPVADVFLYRARVKDLEETDRNNMKALAKPFYEEYITLKGSTPPTEERIKKNLAESYAYLGAYNELIAKDHGLAIENYNKAKDIYPDNTQAKAFFARQESLTSKTK